jgi:hypothetical protein
MLYFNISQPVNIESGANLGIALVKARRLCIKSDLFCFILFSVLELQFWTLTFARQVLYHLNHALKPLFCFSCFSDLEWCSAQNWPQYQYLYLSLWCSWEHRRAPPKLTCLFRWDLTNIFPGIAMNCDPSSPGFLISTSQLTGNAGMSHFSHPNICLHSAPQCFTDFFRGPRNYIGFL